MYDKKKTVLYVRTDIAFVDFYAGGSVSHTVGVIEGFRALGYRVICASSSMISVLKTVCPEYLQLNYFLLNVLRWRINCIFSTFFFAWQSALLFKKFDIDFIYQRYSILNTTGLLLSWWYKKVLILEYNGSEVWIVNNWSKEREWFKLWWLSEKIELLNVRKADYVVVVSQALKDELTMKGVHKNKILVQPNGVNSDLFDSKKLLSVRKEVRNKAVAKEAVVFGFTGTFSYWHGIDVIAQIIPALVAKIPSVYFILIGDGPLFSSFYKEMAIRKLEKHILCTGLVYPKENRKYLSACDIFLCPTQPNSDGSPFFGSPTKLFEYMALGKPIVASRIGQIIDVVANKQYLVEPHDIERFIDVSCELACMDEKKREEIGQKERLRVEKNYTWNHHVQAIISQSGV